MLSRSGALERTVDHLDLYDLDIHHLPSSNWASMWRQRLQQKRHADCEETPEITVAKRQRTCREARLTNFIHWAGRLNNIRKLCYRKDDRAMRAI